MDIESVSSTIDKCIKRIEHISDTIEINMNAFIYSKADNNQIAGKYQITEHLKESTFSFVYLVT